MTLPATQLTPLIDTDIKADREIWPGVKDSKEVGDPPGQPGVLVVGQLSVGSARHVGHCRVWDDIGVMRRVLSYAFDSARVLDRVTLLGKQALA